MASEFDSIWESAESIVFETMGEAVSFTPAGSSAVAATAIIGAERVDDSYDDQGRQQVTTRQCELQIGTGTLVSDVNIDDVVTIDSADWKVDDIIAKTATACKVMLVIEKRKSKHNQSHVMD